jgi:hypothetical protein
MRRSGYAGGVCGSGEIKKELEQVIHFKIDIVNFRDSLRNSFKQNILKDAIYI